MVVTAFSPNNDQYTTEATETQCHKARLTLSVVVFPRQTHRIEQHRLSFRERDAVLGLIRGGLVGIEIDRYD